MKNGIAAIGLLLCASAAYANVALFLEEPHGTFGDVNPTGHAAIYLSNVCADSLTSLRPCEPGELGVVISRYHRIGGFDWIAIPLVPYLYSVDSPQQVPQDVAVPDVVRLRDDYRRKHLEEVVPDLPDGSAPKGDWTQLIGASYDRTIYSFELRTTAEQDDQFIRVFNSRRNKTDFHILFHNCADFARQAMNFYYPRAVRRSLIGDAGIMTPKQAAKSVLQYAKKHPQDDLLTVVIPQVPGTVPRSTPVRGVLESVLRSKKYMVPLAPLAVLHPLFGGTLAFAWVEDRHFDPRHLAAAEDPATQPAVIAQRLESNPVVPPRTLLQSPR